MGTSPQRQVFRPHRVFIAASAFSAFAWAAAFFYLLHFGDVPARLLIAVGAFSACFAIATTYYARSAVFVDSSGLRWRGLLRTQQVSFGDILKLDVLPGPITVYSVRARDGRVLFTSLFRRHRNLAELIVEKSGLTQPARS